ncbi:hypothetical protein RHMOL_Rhmol11G0011900 [Rhododendron molle]|uniref:Uncharacterized protein n=1 Tax=Rhododendron molle TaxID=49168 RepID=A0ACC0LP21_RHOML|nr:hypothetical protein RHMOL_Rhmol11G0011900 [Rhododendron molle]
MPLQQSTSGQVLSWMDSHNSLNISHSIKPGMMAGWPIVKRPCSILWMVSPYTCFFSRLNLWSPKKSTTGTLSRFGRIPWIWILTLFKAMLYRILCNITWRMTWFRKTLGF